MYGAAAPSGVAVAVPLLNPVQVPVLDIVGGQQEICAVKFTEGSFVQPTLVHEPDSPSPDVFTATDKLIPGLQPVFTLTVQQKFHWLAGGVIINPEAGTPSPKLFPGEFPAPLEVHPVG